MQARTSISLLLLVLLVLAGCGRPRGGRGGSSDDDDAANDDDSAVDDDDATGDDDDATGDDDDDDDDDDDGSGEYDGDWSGLCAGTVLVSGLPEMSCAGTIAMSVVSGVSSGSMTCTMSQFPISCDGSWTDGPVPGSVQVEMPGCFAQVVTLELLPFGAGLLLASADYSDGTTNYSVECQAGRD